MQIRISVVMWMFAIISTLVSIFLTTSLLVHYHRQSVRQQLRVTSRQLVAMGIKDFSTPLEINHFEGFVEEALGMGQANKTIRLYDHDKNLVFSSLGLEHDLFPETLSQWNPKGTFWTLRGKRRKYESLVYAYQNLQGQRLYLQVLMPLPPYLTILKSLWVRGVTLLCFLLLVALLLAKILAKRLTNPITKVASYVEALDLDQVETWQPLVLDHSTSYLQSIVVGINALSARTRSTLLKLKRMGRFVAHEMRTPLTILQGEAETLLLNQNSSREDYQRVLRSSLEEVHRLSQTVDTVLKLGDFSSPGVFRPEAVEMVSWLKNNRVHLERTLRRKLLIRFPSKKIVLGTDPQMLLRLLDNLVRNIYQHTPKKSAVEISLWQENQKVQLELRDDGPGLSLDKIKSLNDYLYQPEPNQGLGLNLCQTIVELLGIKWEFQNRKNNGLLVRLIWPRPQVSR